MTNDQGPSNDVSKHPRLAWAAYTIDRNFYFIEAWRSALLRIAQEPDRPWELDSTLSFLSESCSEPPTQCFSQLEEALVELALDGVVDAAVLVELHRVLDRLVDNCNEMGGLTTIDDRGGVEDLYWSIASDWNVTIRLLRDCITDSKLQTYQECGTLVGGLVLQLTTDSDPDLYLPYIQRLIKLESSDRFRFVLQQLLPFQERALRLDSNSSLSEIGQVRSDALRTVLELDSRLEIGFDNDDAEPLIVFDDENERLTFLGTTMDLSEINGTASGGLACLRVLVQRPDVAISVNNLIGKADLACDPDRIKEYLSRLRTKLRPAIQEWVSVASDYGLKRLAEKAFLVSAKQRCPVSTDPEVNSITVIETTYKLALPRSRVCYKAAL